LIHSHTQGLQIQALSHPACRNIICDTSKFFATIISLILQLIFLTGRKGEREGCVDVTCHDDDEAQNRLLENVPRFLFFEQTTTTTTQQLKNNDNGFDFIIHVQLFNTTL
jgi:hypothetical protein